MPLRSLFISFLFTLCCIATGMWLNLSYWCCITISKGLGSKSPTLCLLPDPTLLFLLFGLIVFVLLLPSSTLFCPPGCDHAYTTDGNSFIGSNRAQPLKCCRGRYLNIHVNVELKVKGAIRIKRKSG